MKHSKKEKKITYYKDNPNLKRIVIETVSGDKEYRKNCIKIGDHYFVKNIQCVIIRGKYYSIINNKNVIFDEEKKVYDLAKYAKNYNYGIIKFDKYNQPIYGYYSPNEFTNCYVCFSGKIINNIKDEGRLGRRSSTIIQPNKNLRNCISSSVLPKDKFIKDLNTNIYYYNVIEFNNIKVNSEHLKEITDKLSKSLKTKRSFSTRGKNYVAENNDFSNKVYLYSRSKFPIEPKIRKMAKFLGDYTFGIEVECDKGNLDDNFQAKYGLVLCKDGSIGYTPEFATVPYQGAKGLQATKDVFQELEKTCTTDFQRSIHVHFGNIPSDRGFLVSLYHLFLRIQNELYEIFPRYKYDNNGIKNMNYTQPSIDVLGSRTINSKNDYRKEVNNYYYAIYRYLNAGKPFDFKYNKKTKRHLKGDLSRNKWNIKSRYHALNMTNLFFSKRNTIEFRLHQAVLEDYKMFNWLFICAAITRYAENYQKRILLDPNSITLDEVITKGLKLKTHPTRTKKIVSYLNSYVVSRKKVFKEDFRKADYISDGDGKGDPRYSFESIFLQI